MKNKKRWTTIPEEVANYIYKNPKKALAIAGATITLGITASFGFLSENEPRVKPIEIVKEELPDILCMKDNRLEKQISAYQERKKPFVLKVTPTGYTYADIYETIDQVKVLFAKQDLNCPVLFDIEPLMKHETIRANCLLAEEFCNKLAANGFYVGLYGTDESMNKFEQKFYEVTETHSIDIYDKLIVYKGEKPTYDGTFSMSQKEDKDVNFEYNLQDLIKEKNLNSSDNYQEDLTYTIEEGEQLYQLAKNMNMKTDDLAEYNKIEDPNLINVGQTIVIPNHYQEDKEVAIEKPVENLDQEEMPSEIINRLVKGIDVSEYQGDINWSEVANEVDFAIIRLCDFYHKREDGTCKLDEKFYQNMKACEELNIPVGVYYFSRATTKEEAEEEAKFTAECLKTYSLEYPVYMDVETAEQNQMIDNNSSEMKEIIIAAMSQLEEEGYYAGIYCNYGLETNTNRRMFIDSLSQEYTFWLTSNATYDVNIAFERFKAEDYPVVLAPTISKAVFQYCQAGTIPGIDGQIDLNYGTKILTDSIEDAGFSKVKVQ